MKRKELQQKLDSVNKVLVRHNHKPMFLDYYRYGGGYCLTNEQGSYNQTRRMSAQSLYDYLDGIALGMFYCENPKEVKSDD